eukprot:Skav224378  [mRNA]  locus=scaffold1155:67785:69974:+ [translate_table: standard]
MASLLKALRFSRGDDEIEARPHGWLPPIGPSFTELRSSSRCSVQRARSQTRVDLSTPSTSTPLSLPPISRSGTPHSGPWTPATRGALSAVTKAESCIYGDV